MISFVDNALYEYFKYKNCYYRFGTHVMFSDAFVKKHAENGNLIWKRAYFSHRFVCNQENKYCFIPTEINYVDRCKYSYQVILDEDELDVVIEEITNPLFANVIPIKQKKDWEVQGVLIGWVVYIIILLISLLFNEFYYIWGVATAVFIFWRAKKKKE